MSLPKTVDDTVTESAIEGMLAVDVGVDSEGKWTAPLGAPHPDKQTVPNRHKLRIRAG